MALILYAHPFSSYCWKVLIGLWENGAAFDYRNVADPGAAAEWRRLSPFGKMPLLIDDGEAVFETSIIVEHLALRHPGPVAMIPTDAAAALEARLLDRVADAYLSGPMQTIVFDRLREEDRRDPTGVAKARKELHRAYTWWDCHMAGREWAAGAFGLADCAAAPALFYADWIEPIPDRHASLRAYRARLLARPSIARAVDEAQPYRGGFPLGDPGRD